MSGACRSGSFWATPRRPLGRSAFLQGMIQGATFLKRPFAQAEAVSWGVAPAPPVLRPRSASRPARIANRVTEKALPRPRMLRTVCKPGFPGAPRMLRRGIFPATSAVGSSNGPTTAPPWGTDMVRSLQADAVLAFNHALFRDRARNPRNSVECRFDPDNRGLSPYTRSGFV